MKKELTFSKNGMLLLLVFASAMLFSGCRKDKKNPITFDIIAHQPHLDAPVCGVKWTIRERKYKGWGTGHQYTDWEMEGETDINGRASGEFPPKKNIDYSYVISFDYSNADVPIGEYDVNYLSHEVRELNRPISGANDFEIRMIPKMNFDIHYKNVNCFDANDTFKYKTYNLDEKPNYSQAQIEGINWSTGISLNGCADVYSPTCYCLAGHYIYMGGCSKWDFGIRKGHLFCCTRSEFSYQYALVIR